MNVELSCRQCRDALVELTAGTISAADRQAVERHLASCAECRRERENWLALGDAIRASGEGLPTDSGFAPGLMRLRTALALLNDDDFEYPEGDNLLMERDSRITDTRAPVAWHEGERPATPATEGALRWRLYSAIAATMAIVVLMALVFGTLATRLQPTPGFGAGGVATPTPTPTLASQTELRTVPGLPVKGFVASISMDSASDGWAVVDLVNSKDSMLLHYTNGQWTPSGDTYAGVSLSDVSMDSPDDGWAVGVRPDQIIAVVLHYTGGRWSAVHTPTIVATGGRVWAFSPTQVLVLAALPQDENSYAGDTLARYDNGTWTQTDSPRQISSMSVVSADDFWAVCSDGHVLHYQGGQWTMYSIAGQGVEDGGGPLAISMLSDSDGWVTGSNSAPWQSMFLAHFDGHTWTQVQGPVTWSGTTRIWAMSLVSPSEGWAGGDLTHPGSLGSEETVLLHYVNGRWEQTAVRYRGTIQTIVMVSATEGWATVNDWGTVGLLHYQNGQWTPYTPQA